MKKITLLLTILCASQLYGMEIEKPKIKSGYDSYISTLLYGRGLPTDVQGIIIASLNQNLSLKDAIEFIKIASMTNKELNKMINLNDLKGFTNIVHILAHKFNMPTLNIAEQFNSPISKKYIELVELAINFVKMHGKETYLFNEWIKNGLDVNATWSNDRMSLLMYASFYGNKPVVKLLLESHANPHYKNNNGKTALDFLLSSHLPIKYPEDIEQLLRDAMQSTIANDGHDKQTSKK